MKVPKFIVGAYATGAGLRPADELALTRSALATPGVDGLETPVFGDRLHDDQPGLLETLGTDKTLILTLIGATVEALASNQAYGLASSDELGRAHALSSARHACDAIARVNDCAGRAVVTGIEVHSAPRAWHGSSGEYLSRSLDELASWDWQSAELLLEHCDAARPPAPAAKGFLRLDEEIEAITRSGAPVGLVINWGRSAIEGRSAKTPLQHIEAARSAGQLRGLVFSGASGAAHARGGAWADVHLAPADDADPDDPSSLNASAIADCLAAVASVDLAFIGLKVSLGRQASFPSRAAVLARSLEQMHRHGMPWASESQG